MRKLSLSAAAFSSLLSASLLVAQPMAAEPSGVPELSLPVHDAEPVLLASAATIHSRILNEDRTFLIRVPPKARKNSEAPSTSPSSTSWMPKSTSLQLPPPPPSLKPRAFLLSGPSLLSVSSAPIERATLRRRHRTPDGTARSTRKLPFSGAVQTNSWNSSRQNFATPQKSACLPGRGSRAAC